MPDAGNLFASLPEAARSEAVDALLERDGVTVERIVSRGQTSPAESGGGDSGGGDFGGGDSGGGDSGGGWYDQDRHEWVGVLRGAARLMFEGGRGVQLGPGDLAYEFGGNPVDAVWCGGVRVT